MSFRRSSANYAAYRMGGGGLASSPLPRRDPGSIGKSDGGSREDTWESRRTHMGASPGITFGLPRALPALTEPPNLSQACKYSGLPCLQH